MTLIIANKLMHFGKQILNLSAWRTNRKIVIFESDDWGSNRMPSREVYDNLVKNEVIDSFDKNQFYKYDSLESYDDLTGLFDILSSFKDINGNHPVFTAVNVLANPDFKKIKDSNFEEYHYELFTKTAERYNKGRVLDLWKQGAENKIFVPQFHGREHLNVMAWLRALKDNKEKTRIAFDNEVYGINSVKLGESSVQYLASFDVEKKEDLKFQEESIIDGLMLFEAMMGYKAVFFVPSNGPFNLSLEKPLSELGIKYLMLNKFQREPLGAGRYNYRFRYLGKKNKFRQIYLSRNVSFEPSAEGIDWVDYTMSQVEMAFKHRIPAVIGTHRVNYIGSLHPENRDKGLRELSTLLKKLINKYPNVEFMSSSQLGEQIASYK